MNNISLIEKYLPYNEQETIDKNTILECLKTYQNIYLRENQLAHITVSSWIINESRTKVLMVYHNIYQSWSWTGGHADGNTNFLEVAIKEAREETGINSFKVIDKNIYSLEVLCVDGHLKNNKFVPCHLHLNVTFLLEASEDERLVINKNENSGVRWFLLDEAIDNCTEVYMKKIYRKLNEKLKGDYK